MKLNVKHMDGKTQSSKERIIKFSKQTMHRSHI